MAEIIYCEILYGEIKFRYLPGFDYIPAEQYNSAWIYSLDEFSQFWTELGPIKSNHEKTAIVAFQHLNLNLLVKIDELDRINHCVKLRVKNGLI